MVEVIAHRGASAEAPENSMEAFQLAIALGCDWMECDVHLSADDIPVVVHDLEIDGHPVATLTASQLGLPTLADVLALDRGSVGLMVELKVDCAEAVLKVVEGEERIVVGSLAPSVVAKIPPHLAIGIARTNDALRAHRKMNLEHLAVSHQLDFAGSWVWTIDDVDHAHQVIAAGARGIITNDPRTLLTHLR